MSVENVGPVQIYAPISGLVRPLDRVPDPAFAQKMVGDGIAIDPLDEVLRAPFNGTVSSVASTGHAVTLRSDEGLELLLHLGIDTVGLQGRGFTALVAPGQYVRVGEELLRFSADEVGIEARSLITPIVLANGGVVVRIDRDRGRIEAGEPLFSALLRHSANGAVSPSEEQPTYSLRVELPLPHGLHARPSARIAEVAKAFAGSISFTFQSRTADATSTTGLMALGAIEGSAVDIQASGAGAREIVTELITLLDSLGAAEAQSAALDSTFVQPPALPAKPLSVTQIAGVCAVSGLAIGRVHQIRLASPDFPERGIDPGEEERKFRDALQHLTNDLERLVVEARKVAAEIGRAHLAILQDRSLASAALSNIREGFSAGRSWQMASRAQESAFTASASSRMRERAIDLRDVERRLLSALYGGEKAVAPPKGAIVVSDDIEPSLLVDMPRGHIAGICTSGGGATSHAAILSASLGIPMLVAAGASVMELTEGKEVILDAGRGYLETDPPLHAVEEAHARIAANETASADARTLAVNDCYLADGTRIKVFANLASATDATDGVAMGAEGCGLLRTEFIFAESAAAPDEDSQAAIYREIANSLGGRPLIVRTLDVGGDKPLEYLPFPAEANPALGMRGVRFSLQEKQLLRTQLRAILRGVPSSQLRIMIPMIVELRELEEVREYIAQACADLGITATIPVGIMVETPAAVLLSAQLATVADFLSVGSNDLTQYVLAMDRGNAGLAARVDACHPAVLSAICQASASARRYGRWLGICGGLASDPDAAPLLVGLGCDELSAIARAVPAIKQRLRGWTLASCQELAHRALEQSSADAVRKLLVGEAR